MLLVNRLLSRITSQELTAARKAAEGLRVQAPRVGLVRATLHARQDRRIGRWHGVKHGPNAFCAFDPI